MLGDPSLAGPSLFLQAIVLDAAARAGVSASAGMELALLAVR